MSNNSSLSKDKKESNNNKNIVEIIPLSYKRLDEAECRTYYSLFDKHVFNIENSKDNSADKSNCIEYGPINNIAITGSYGVGKSSLIKSYVAEKKLEDKTVFISLADVDENTYKNTNAILDEKILEKKIINQLIYSTKQENLSGTKFEPHYEGPIIKRTLILSIVSLIWFCTMIYFYKSNILPTLFYKLIEKSELVTSILFILIVAVSLVSLGYVVYFVYQNILNKSIDRIKLDKYEASFNENNSITDLSYIDEHLHDLLWILNKSKNKYYVFEDIDRVEDENIFIKLKEINTLLNVIIEKNKSNKDENVKFIYILRDDIFPKSTKRNKFFDLVIPVVPFISHHTSRDYFIEKMGCSSTDSLGELISLVSIYLDDVRTINNIVNEYKIYENKLFSEANNMDKCKLLAIMVYKSFCPIDYSSITTHRSFLSNLFSSRTKYKFISTIKESDISKKQELQSELNELKETQHKLMKIEEVAYMNLIKYYYIEGRPNTNFTNSSLLQVFRGKSKEECLDLLSTESREALNCFIDSSEEEELKLKIIDKENEIKKLDSSIEMYKSKTINDLFSEKGYQFFAKERGDKKCCIIKEVIKELNDVEDSLNIIFLLIEKCYIDENFKDYIAPFIEGYLTSDDKIYIDAILTGAIIENAFEVKISSTKEIINLLSDKNMTNEFLLNQNILYYCVTNFKNSENVTKCRLLIDMLIESDKLIKFFDMSRKNEKFKISVDRWMEINIHNNKLCEKILEYDDNEIIDRLMYFIENDKFDITNYREQISKLFNKKIDRLFDFKNRINDLAKFDDICSKIDIMYKDIECVELDVANDEYCAIVNKLMIGNCIELNYHNILQILGKVEQYSVQTMAKSIYAFITMYFADEGVYKVNETKYPECKGHFIDTYSEDAYKNIKCNIDINRILKESLGILNDQKFSAYDDFYKFIKILISDSNVDNKTKIEYIKKCNNKQVINNYDISRICKPSLYISLFDEEFVSLNIHTIILYLYIKYIELDEIDLEYFKQDFIFDYDEIYIDGVYKEECIKKLIRASYQEESVSSIENFINILLKHVSSYDEVSIKTFSSFDKLNLEGKVVQYNFNEISQTKIDEIIKNDVYNFKKQDVVSLFERYKHKEFNSILESFLIKNINVITSEMTENSNDWILKLYSLFTSKENKDVCLDFKLLIQYEAEYVITDDDLLDIFKKYNQLKCKISVDNLPDLLVFLRKIGEDKIVDCVKSQRGTFKVEYTELRNEILELLKNHYYINKMKLIENDKKIMITSNNNYGEIE